MSQNRRDIDDKRVTVMHINGSAFLTLDGDGSPRTYLMVRDEKASQTLRRVRADYTASVMRMQKWIENIDAVINKDQIQ